MEDVLVKRDEFHLGSMNIEGIYAELPILVMFFFQPSKLKLISANFRYYSDENSDFMLTPYKIQNINS